MPPLRGRFPVVCLLGLLLAHHSAAGTAQMTGAPRSAAASSAARFVARDANATSVARDSDSTGASDYVTCQRFLTGGGADARSAMTREAAYAPARFAKQKMASPTRAAAELLRNRSGNTLLRPVNTFDRPFLGCDDRLLGAAPALPWPFDSLGGGGPVQDGALGITYHGGDVMTTAVTKVYLIWYGGWEGHPARTVLPHCVKHASGERTAALLRARVRCVQSC
jgi:hypothetical protein